MQEGGKVTKRLGVKKRERVLGRNEGKGRGEVEQVYLINCRKRESRERRREGIVFLSFIHLNFFHVLMSQLISGSLLISRVYLIRYKTLDTFTFFLSISQSSHSTLSFLITCSIYCNTKLFCNITFLLNNRLFLLIITSLEPNFLLPQSTINSRMTFCEVFLTFNNIFFLCVFMIFL